MANIKLETIVDYVLKAGKVENEAAVQAELDKVLHAVINKLHAPDAAIDLPVQIKNVKLTSGNVAHLQKQLGEQIAKLDAELAKAIRTPDAASKALRKRQERAHALLKEVSDTLNKPIPKITPTTLADMKRLLGDPLQIDKILSERNGSKRLANLQGYSRHIAGMQKELNNLQFKLKSIQHTKVVTDGMLRAQRAIDSATPPPAKPIKVRTPAPKVEKPKAETPAPKEPLAPKVEKPKAETPAPKEPLAPKVEKPKAETPAPKEPLAPKVEKPKPKPKPKIDLSPITEQITHPKKAEDVAGLQHSLNQVAAALVKNLKIPKASFDLPVELKNIKLNKGDITALKAQLQSELKKANTEIEKLFDKVDPQSNQLRSKHLAAKDLFTNIDKALDKTPTSPITQQMMKDMRKVIADPLQIHEIAKGKNGAQRVDNLRAYAKYIEDYNKEIFNIHSKASTGRNVASGAGETFQIGPTEKVSLPLLGGTAKTISDQLAAATREMQPTAMAKRANKEQAIKSGGYALHEQIAQGTKDALDKQKVADKAAAKHQAMVSDGYSTQEQITAGLSAAQARQRAADKAQTRLDNLKSGGHTLEEQIQQGTRDALARQRVADSARAKHQAMVNDGYSTAEQVAQGLRDANAKQRKATASQEKLERLKSGGHTLEEQIQQGTRDALARQRVADSAAAEAKKLAREQEYIDRSRQAVTSAGGMKNVTSLPPKDMTTVRKGLGLEIKRMEARRDALAAQMAATPVGTAAYQSMDTEFKRLGKRLPKYEEALKAVKGEMSSAARKTAEAAAEAKKLAEKAAREHKSIEQSRQAITSVGGLSQVKNLPHQAMPTVDEGIKLVLGRIKAQRTELQQQMAATPVGTAAYQKLEAKFNRLGGRIPEYQKALKAIAAELGMTGKKAEKAAAEAKRMAQEQLAIDLSNQAIHRVGGYDPGSLINLARPEQATVSKGLKLEEQQILKQRKELEAQMVVAKTSNNQPLYQNLLSQHAQLGSKLPEIQQGLKFVNAEMKGLAGFTHQAAVATQQFLKYAVLYGTGYKLMSGIGSLFSDTAGLDKALHAIQAISQASKNEMAVVEESIKKVSEASQFSTNEISQAAQVLAQAGVQINHLPSILTTVSKLASTTSADLKTSSEVLTSLSEAFDMTEPMQMAALADRLAQAVNVSKLTTEGLRTIVSLSASTAKLSGVSDTQLLASSAVLANRGVKDSTIATGLREVMVELFSPDAKLLSFLKDRYAKIGEGLMGEAEIRSKFQHFTKADDPIQSALLELRRLGVSGSARNEFNRVTETRAQNVLLPLLETLDKRLDNIAQISQAGAIDRGAATNMEAISNAFSGLQSAAVSLTHEMVNGFLPTLVEGTKNLKSFLEKARQNIIKSEGEDSGAVQHSIITGVLAGLWTFIKTPGNLLQRGSAALGVGSVVGGADILAHTQGDTGSIISKVGETAVTAATVYAIFRSIADRTGGITELLDKLKTNFGKFFGLFTGLLSWSVWGRVAAALAVATPIVYGAYKFFDGAGNPQARLQTATKQSAEQQKRQDDTTIAYAPFNATTKDSQAALIEKARKDFTQAKTKIAGILGKSIVPDELLETIAKLGKEGGEANSPAQKDILAKIEGADKLSKEKIAALTEEGYKVSASQAIIASQARQQLREINAALTSTDPTPVQKSLLAVYRQMSASVDAEEKRIISGVAKVDLKSFDKVSKTLVELYRLVLNDAPKQLANEVSTYTDNLADALTNMKGVGELDFEKLVSHIRVLADTAAQGTAQAIEDNIKLTEAVGKKLKKKMADTEAKDPGWGVGPRHGSKVKAYEEEKAYGERLLPEIEAILAGSKEALATKTAQEAKEKADKAETERLADIKRLKESEFSQATASATQSQYIGDMSASSQELAIAVALKKAQESRDLAAQEGLLAEQSALKQAQARRELLMKGAVFAEAYNKNYPPSEEAVQNGATRAIDIGPNTSEDDRLSLYADMSSNPDYIKNAATGSDALKAAFAEMKKAVGEATITLPGETEATLAGIDRQQQEHELNTQLNLIQEELKATERKIQLAKTQNLLDQQVVSLANQQYNLRIQALEATKKIAQLHYDNPKAVAAQAATAKNSAEDEKVQLLADARRLTLEKERATLGKQLRTTNKAVDFAADTGNMGGIQGLQKMRDTLAFRKLGNELESMKANNALDTDITAHREEGTDNILNQRYQEHVNTISKYSDIVDKQFQGSKKFALFSDEQQGYRQATGQEMTGAQSLAETQGQLAVAQAHKQAQEQVKTALEVAQSFALTEEGAKLFADRLEESKKSLDNTNHSIGEFKGRIATLTATMTGGIKSVSYSGVLAEFEKLNPGFTQVRQQIESNLAGTLDGVTHVIGDFIANGFSAVRDLQALSSALQNTAQAEGNYQSTVSNRAQLLYSVEASPSFIKESQAVQALIIEQATAAQKAAEAAAAQQVAIARAQQAQVQRENSLGGQLSTFIADSNKSLFSTMAQDFMGDGIKKLLGMGTKQTNKYDPKGNLLVAIGDGLPLGEGLADDSPSLFGQAYDWVAEKLGVSSASPMSATSPESNASLATAPLKALGETATSAAYKVNNFGQNSQSSTQLMKGMSEGLNIAFQSTASAATEGIAATTGDTQALVAHTAAVNTDASAIAGSTAANTSQAASGAANSGGFLSSITGMLGFSSGNKKPEKGSTKAANEDGTGEASAEEGTNWGAIASIATSVFSIGTTIANYFASADAYDAVIAAATARNNDTPVVPTSDPTKNTNATTSSDTQYGPLAGYLSQDKYQNLMANVSEVLSAGALVQQAASPAQFVKDTPVDTRQTNPAGTTLINNIDQTNSGDTTVMPPQVNLRMVNVIDPSIVHNYMGSSEGEKIILNTIHANASSVKETLHRS